MIPAVLVGDVGGTSARFAVALRHGGAIRLERFDKLPGDGHGDFSSILGAYRAEHPDGPSRALFALAGPPSEDGSVTLTNRDWPRIDPRRLEAEFGLEQVELVNDFAAMARAVPEMPERAFEPILDGTPDTDAPVVITGPGTGFGVASLIADAQAGRYHVITGEGGFAAYAPRTLREAEIAALMRERHGYVHNEMMLSGKWLQPLYDVICAVHGRETRPVRSREILERAEQGDPLAEELCLLRACGVLGAAGDAALINGARGGVVLTGGVAERIIPWLKTAEAGKRFRERGSHSDYVGDIPVSVMAGDTAPLIGAAALMFEHLDED